MGDITFIYKLSLRLAIEKFAHRYWRGYPLQYLWFAFF